jgi:hypothetical protein
VAVLDFGSQQDDDAGDGRSRMPWVSNLYPIGNLTPLVRFVIGLNESLDDFRSKSDEPQQMDDAESRRKDPWNEVLFHRPPPARTPARNLKTNGPAKDESKSADGPNAPRSAPKPDASANEQSAFDAFWQQCPEVDPPFLAPTTVARSGFRFDLCAMILAGVLLVQNPREVSRRSKTEDWQLRRTRTASPRN